MTDVEKLAMMRVLADAGDEVKDYELYVYLNLAKSKILARAFPFDDSHSDVPTRYGFIQCEIATYLWNKRGADGQTAHSENGISRQYENGDVPESMLSQIIPYCGTLSKRENDE